MGKLTALRTLIGSALISGFLICGLAALGMAAEVAATIEYEVVQRPANLSEGHNLANANDFKPAAGTSLKFLSIKAIDGFQVQAALWQPEGKKTADTTIIVMIHGSGGSYQRAPESGLAQRIVQKGYAALAISSRQSDDKINTDNYFDIRRDLDAAVHTARSLGYKKIVLQGHSLGNIQVQFYAATNWDSDLKGVILLGPFGNLPWKTYNILVQNEAGFKQLVEAAFKALREGKTADIMPVKMGYWTGREEPVTAQHFLTYRWDKTSVADGTFWIRRVPQPVLIVRDQADALVLPFEPHMLVGAANTEGSLVTSIDYKLLPNSNPPSLEGHYFIGNEEALLDAVTGWLEKNVK